MAVASAGEFTRTRFTINGHRVWQGFANTNGDVSGGTWALTLTWPRSLSTIVRPLDIFARGDGDAVFDVALTGARVQDPETTFFTPITQMTFTAGNEMAANDQADWLRANPILWYHLGNLAANNPGMVASGANVNGTDYTFVVNALMIEEDLRRPVGRFTDPSLP